MVIKEINQATHFLKCVRLVGQRSTNHTDNSFILQALSALPSHRNHIDYSGCRPPGARQQNPLLGGGLGGDPGRAESPSLH